MDSLCPPSPDDTEFEVTAEMMIHGDVDDEETLDEEEALQSREEIEDEVDNLQEVRREGGRREGGRREGGGREEGRRRWGEGREEKGERR